VSDHPLDGKRVAHLLELLRRRTPEEITTGVMALAGFFSPEMWRALQLLRLRPSRNLKKQRRPDDMPGIGSTPTVLVNDDV
jgi:hypothetical protein